MDESLKARAYLNQAASDPVKLSDIQACVEDLNSIACDLEQRVDALQKLHGRLYGERGEDGNAEPKPVPSGAIGRLQETVARIRKIDADLGHAVGGLLGVA